MSCADCETCSVDTPAPTEVLDSCRHELHVTVHQVGGVEAFRYICAVLGLRSIQMGIRLPNRSLAVEWMTGSGYEGDDAGACQALALVGDQLAAAGYDPIRAKIEAAPWHPRATLERRGATNSFHSLPAGSYWESHLGIWVSDDKLDAVHRMVYLASGYLSQNLLKASRRGQKPGLPRQSRWSVTIRSEFLSRENQERQAEAVAGWLRDAGADVDAGVRHEWTWLDRAMDPAMPGGPPSCVPS